MGIKILKHMYVEKTIILCGPNGVGKTRDLDSIISRGEKKPKYIPILRHDEINFSGYARQGRVIPFLAPDVIGSLIMNLLLHGFSLDEAQEKALDVLRMAGMEYLKDRTFRNLSGGEAQIVNVLTAVLLAKDALLLDDPFSMLDDVRMIAMKEMIKKLHSYESVFGGEIRSVIVTTTKDAGDNGEYAWLETRDFTKIKIKYTDYFEEILNVFLIIGNIIARERIGTSSIYLEDFSLKFIYDKKVMFDPIRYKFDSGNNYCVKAPNGYGKSLLLGAISGNVSRNIIQNVCRYVTHKVYPLLQCVGNIEFPEKNRYIFVSQYSELLLADEGPEKEIWRILNNASIIDENLLKKVFVVIPESKKIGEYSYGEARFITAIVAILNALSDPSIMWLMLDEIDSRLDSYRQNIINKLLKIYTDKGGGVIRATHSSIITECTEVLKLNRDGS
jgi:ABC-type Mn2+/Zn2+ transport system ATPase subunit